MHDMALKGPAKRLGSGPTSERLRLIVLVALLCLPALPCQAAFKDCDVSAQLRDELVGAQTNFTGCLAYYAAPVQICERCVSLRKAYLATYDQLPSACKDYGVFKDIHDALVGPKGTGGIWADNHCDECNLTDLQIFTAKICQFSQCIDSSTMCESYQPRDAASQSDDADSSASSSTPQSVVPVGNSTDICDRCRAYYQDVCDFHDKLSPKCQLNADVIDRFRRIIEYWQLHHCTVTHVRRDVMYVVMAIALLVPLAYYWSVYLWAKMSRARRAQAMGLEAHGQDKPLLGPGRQRAGSDSSVISTMSLPTWVYTSEEHTQAQHDPLLSNFSTSHHNLSSHHVSFAEHDDLVQSRLPSRAKRVSAPVGMPGDAARVSASMPNGGARSPQARPHRFRLRNHPPPQQQDREMQNEFINPSFPHTNAAEDDFFP